MTKGMRKVRQGVDIFDKRILDSCSSQTLLQNMASFTAIFSSQPAEYKPVSVHGAQTIRILLSMFPLFLCLARGKGKRCMETPLLLCTIIFFFFPRKDALMGLIPHRVMFSRKELERVVLESDCSELP